MQKVLLDSPDTGRHRVNGNVDQAGGVTGKGGGGTDCGLMDPMQASKPRNNGPYKILPKTFITFPTLLPTFPIFFTFVLK